MPELQIETIIKYRNRTYHILPELRLKSSADAVRFVNENGFIFFWPIKGINLPNLWVATAGDRPLPDNHDDPGHVTWEWKDQLLSKKLWYYGRVLRRRNTIIALTSLPYFYALSPNYGDPQNDYLDQYEQGTITREAKMIYEALLVEGPLDTISLRRVSQMSNSTSAGRFNKALDDLQTELKVLPVGISPVGAWRYGFVYDIVTRHFPDLQGKAQIITESEARIFLARQYCNMVAVAQLSELGRLFHWTESITLKTVKTMIDHGDIVDHVQISGAKGKYLAITKIFENI